MSAGTLIAMAAIDDSPLTPRSNVSRRRSRLPGFLIALLVLGALGTIAGLYGLRAVTRIDSADGTQMLPTVAPGDRMVVALRSFRTRLPERGDLVMVQPPDGGAPFPLRVVAVAGDTVEVFPGSVRVDGVVHDREWVRETLKVGARSAIRFNGGAVQVDRIERASFLLGGKADVAPGRVLVNGVPIADATTREDPDYAVKPLTVPPDHVYVLGDNRNAAVDSHVWGAIPRSALRGKVLRVMR